MPYYAIKQEGLPFATLKLIKKFFHFEKIRHIFSENQSSGTLAAMK